MLKIRLRRVGKKKQPSFRIVIAESTSPRDGKFVETIGFYNPRTEPETVQYEEERALYWLSVGAQPSESVRRIFKTYGTWERFERMKAGESIEALVEEAKTEEEAEEVAEVTKIVEEATPEEVATDVESAGLKDVEAEAKPETVDEEETEAESDVEAATEETEA
ncbi:MAG: 30S ribosomal protein S16 [Anaerolineales bacterium]